jgi:hypothetical protein
MPHLLRSIIDRKAESADYMLTIEPEDLKN